MVQRLLSKAGFKLDDYRTRLQRQAPEIYECLIRNETTRFVGKRTVYTKNEIEEIAKQPTTVILFKHHFLLSAPIPFKGLISERILSGHPQSIVEIPHEKYMDIKKLGGLDERFTVD